MVQVALAAPSRHAVEVADHVVQRGGGAVDVALAAAIVGMVTEVGVAAPGAGAFVTVAAADGSARVYDGYMAVPGIGRSQERPVEYEAEMAYGGGITTLVGPASIAVPGAWDAFADAHEAHGRLDFAEILEPIRRIALDGFTLGQSSLYYLQYSYDPVFSQDPASRALLAPEARLLDESTRLTAPDLAHSFADLEAEGPRGFLHGELGRRIAEDLQRRGSRIGPEDFADYRTEIRSPLSMTFGGWTLFTNPPPAVGGAGLVALLAAVRESTDQAAYLDAQRRLFAWRRHDLHHSEDRLRDIERYLGSLPGDPIRSPSTVHVSAADQSGVACAITLSAGYGSGVIPTGTGMYMNNGLGELELVGHRDRLVPGERLNSNMAPTVARSEEGDLLAIGSPGADRITTALCSTIMSFAAGRTLRDAVEAPRVHVSVSDDGEARVKAEPGGLTVDTDLPVDLFEEHNMYFGGVGAAMVSTGGEVEAVSDSRRAGVAIVLGRD